MDNLSQVTNDIAHDLRTPVTHLRHRLERARADVPTRPRIMTRRWKRPSPRPTRYWALFAALLRIAQIEGGERRAAFTQSGSGRAHGAVARTVRPGGGGGRPFPASDIDAGSCDPWRPRVADPAILQSDRERHRPYPAGHAASLCPLHAACGQAVAQVSDDGPGVPAEEHERLFRRLYRREASRTQPGYGLGLSLVSAIAELHGARVRIAKEGPGMSVAVSFPLARDAA